MPQRWGASWLRFLHKSPDPQVFPTTRSWAASGDGTGNWALANGLLARSLAVSVRRSVDLQAEKHLLSDAPHFAFFPGSSESRGHKYRAGHLLAWSMACSGEPADAHFVCKSARCVSGCFVATCILRRAFKGSLASRLDIDVTAWNSILNACDKAEKWQHAVEVLHNDRCVADVFGCTAAISACEKSSQWKLTLKLLNAMPEANLEPDDACTFAV